MLQALNPELLVRLRRVYGDVRVANPGVPAAYIVTKHQGDTYWGEITSPGEEYHLDCPYCNDTRKRLYISHLYDSSIMKDGKRVVFGRGLAWCHNEVHCMEDTKNRDALYESLSLPYGLVLDLKDAAPVERRVPVLPANLISISALTANHRAVQYLTGRGFDIDDLSRHNIAYCPHEPNMPLAEDRVFIPIYDFSGEFAGGQCRLLHNPEGRFPPKYWTLPGTPLARLLYNVHFAQGKSPIVVVEGVFDALRVGDHGVATFSNKISPVQFDRIAAVSGGHIVILPDSDVAKTREHASLMTKIMNKFQKQAENWRNLGLRVDIVPLPEGNDPGDFTREELWTKINSVIQ